MPPNIQVGLEVIATQGATLSLGFLISKPVSLDTAEVESGQHWVWHRGRLEKWEFPFFSCSPLGKCIKRG